VKNLIKKRWHEMKKKIRNKIQKGRIRYAFSVSRDPEGNTALYAVRQRFSQKKDRYVNDVKGKDKYGPVAKPVTLEEASGILAAGLESGWSENG
jgi:hypothetical protein